MKTILFSAAAIAALATATPASAQLGDIVQREILRQGVQNLLGGNGSSRVGQLDDRIQRAYQRGEISQQEASALHREYLELREIERDYRRGGLSRNERYDLERRIDRLEQRIQDARNDRDGSYDRDGRWDRDDDDRNWDRDDDDRWDRDDDDRYGRNACPRGLAKKNNGCLPPGQAKKMERYEDRYGDSHRGDTRYVYQRQSDGRVFQIDRRTGEVVRIIRPRGY
ncbi:MAG TPA: hypothetical protein VHM92_04640 [Allosphingosinicella sp.]|nr:hypothetical protein [Allosphingosinicella sp.]